jgi:hypothetical protein
MTWQWSQIVIVPDNRWATLRAWYLTQGFEIGEGVPLGPNGAEPVTHRAFHSWMTPELVAAAEANAPRPWQNDVVDDTNGQSNKTARYGALRGTLAPIVPAQH